MSTVKPSKPNVLVVEDDDVVAKLLEFILTREGFQVTRVADGLTGLHYVLQSEPPSLVMLDVMLPFTNGFDLLKEVRATAGWGEVPVIMLTAKSQESDIVRALDAGASDYLVKPFKPNELKARIKRLVKL